MISKRISIFSILFSSAITTTTTGFTPRLSSWTSSSIRSISVLTTNPSTNSNHNTKLYSSKYNTEQKIPITILSGFLGSGKTTLLQNLLNNKQNISIAVIVNDMAEINIDNKLLVGNTSPSNTNLKPDGIVELSNGCACCELSNDLLPSISELITLSDLKRQADDDEKGFDHVVIELSGVASPHSIRSMFQDAEYYGMPLLDRVMLDTMVTVLDASTFLTFLKNKDGNWVNPHDSPHLFGESISENMIGGESFTVSDLLVEQTEIADILVVNKLDLIQDAKDLQNIETIVEALNPRAKIIKTEYGHVDELSDVLAAARGLGVVDAGITDDHRDTIEAMEDLLQHDGRGHEHGEEEEDACNNPTCTDESHSHSHEHIHHGHADECNDPTCTDESHSHSHEHSATCNDPTCTDESHSHSHSHSHETSIPGKIGSMIFRSRKPFHPKRLLDALGDLPIVHGLPEIHENTNSVMKNVIRSKGFCWLADSHIAAHYWSHAGSSFELKCLGRWWATLPQEQWPEEARDDILVDFDNHNHEESDSFVSVGDRRQEVVLIGEGVGEEQNRQEITRILNECCLTDEEYEVYKKYAFADEEKLKQEFSNTIPVKMMTF